MNFREDEELNARFVLLVVSPSKKYFNFKAQTQISYLLFKLLMSYDLYFEYYDYY